MGVAERRGKVVQTETYVTKEMRTLPSKDEDIVSHPRVRILRKDDMGFTIVEAKLKKGEGVCWRCCSPADDPEGKLQTCPVCGGDFND